MTNRRSVLRLIGLAPIAAPVAAKEAAASMGLKTITTVSAGISGGGIYGGGPPIADVSWVKRALAEFGNAKAQRHWDRHGRELARTLDSDIAAMRSISPAAAYQIQRGRLSIRIPLQERQYLEDELEQELKNRLGLG
jgi:hypothetical protein